MINKKIQYKLYIFKTYLRLPYERETQYLFDASIFQRLKMKHVFRKLS